MSKNFGTIVVFLCHLPLLSELSLFGLLNVLLEPQSLSSSSASWRLRGLSDSDDDDEDAFATFFSFLVCEPSDFLSREPSDFFFSSPSESEEDDEEEPEPESESLSSSESDDDELLWLASYYSWAYFFSSSMSFGALFRKFLKSSVSAPRPMEVK